ncbi:MAG: alpha-amylase family glycosyl hydrolase [Myxococcota bacterium]|nr:alpha-amylase family glycosyl hydrolase [Myxococcota bacterium]
MMASWWPTSVVYQIYPRSFQDSNGDGVGDINGIIRRLPILDRLGVTALWLSPVYPSPQNDFGYDVSDYVEVDPVFGTLEQLKDLINAAKSRGIRVMMDGVFNHTSNLHPWFLDSLDPTHRKHSWYHWCDTVPNNWGSVFGGSAWSLHPSNGMYYLHSFASQQPDLNWRNPEVREAILSVLRFWFELGISGFRLDVFNCYAKAIHYPDNPPNPIWWRRLLGHAYPYIGQMHVNDRDVLDLHGYLNEMRIVADQYDAVLLGETLDEAFQYDNAAKYVNPYALHGAFHFRLLHSKWSCDAFKEAIDAWILQLDEGQLPVWALSNHDFPRLATRWGKTAVKGALALLFMLPGVPVLYNGDELGMRDGRLKRRDIKDPPGKKYWPFFKGRDGCRTPLYWDSSTHAGFTEGEPWLPLNPESIVSHCVQQQNDSESIWNWTRKLIQLRQSNPDWVTASLKWHETPTSLLHFVREGQVDWHFMLNMGRKPYPIEVSGVCQMTNQIVKVGDQLAPNEVLCIPVKRPNLEQ